MEKLPGSELSSKYFADHEDQAMMVNDFVYHTPTEDQIPRYQAIRDMQRLFAGLIIDQVPPSKQRDEALLRLNEVGFWANAGIARNE